jgi:selenide,water dikinase
MGGTPLLGLNLVCWNTEELSNDLLGDVLLGGQDIAHECGFVVAGGHTVDDPEPKYGMAVVGEVHPDKMLTNAGLRADQSLVLTKPLGIGIITTAQKRDVVDGATMQAAITSMTTTNAAGAAAAVAAGASGATDVTGFGLLGHAGRMAQESGVSLEIVVDDVPVIVGATALAADGVVPGGTGRNLTWIEEWLDIGAGVDDLDVTILADAQTSGGLVFGVDPDAADDVVAGLVADGHTAAVIGRAVDGNGLIALRRS